jgi:hypothetical protein
MYSYNWLRFGNVFPNDSRKIPDENLSIFKGLRRFGKNTADPPVRPCEQAGSRAVPERRLKARKLLIYIVFLSGIHSGNLRESPGTISRL